MVDNMISALVSRITLLREEKGLTQKAFTEDIGIHESNIKNWRKGQIPSADKVTKIANYFGVSTDFLLGKTDIRQSIGDVLADNDIISLQRARTRMSQRDREGMMEMLRIGFRYAFEDEDNVTARKTTNRNEDAK